MFKNVSKSGIRIAVGFWLALIALTAAAPAMAGSAVYTSWGKAIRGYDPVAYFTEGKPVEGKGDFTVKWNGATWQFASAANRDTFKAAPKKYAPQYGGYCAWAVSQGYTASTVPEAWKIVDGKLYLNYSKGVQRQWESGGPRKLIAAGDRHWPKLKSELTN